MHYLAFFTPTRHGFSFKKSYVPMNHLKYSWLKNILQENKLAVLTEPTLTVAKSLIEKAFLQRRTIIIAGLCQVNYSGRANSTLELGERILIIKADGSLLVHRPVGYEPVNWQPSGSVFHTQIKENCLEVNAARQKPRENVKIKFSSILLVSALKLLDAGEFVLNASEEDMHKAILIKACAY